MTTVAAKPAAPAAAEERHGLAASSRGIPYDHRDLMLDRAIRKGTDNVTICWLRLRFSQLGAGS